MSALAAPLPAVQPQPFWLLVRVELHKALDTRAGRAVLAVVLGLAVVVLVLSALAPLLEGSASGEPVVEPGVEPVPEALPPSVLSLTSVLDAGLIPVGLLLPVVGLLAMTSEWSQRTALTTFVLAPRRVRVLLAKLVAAALVAVVAVVLTGLLAVVTTALGGLLHEGGAVWESSAWRSLGGGAVTVALGLLMAAAFGALLANTALALVAYFVLPIVVSILRATVLGDDAAWIDVSAAFTRLAAFSLEDLPQTLTALLLWVVVPIVAGLVIASRREVT